MASLALEGIFASLVGGKEVDIDFPVDRLFRKLGVYLPCMFAAILVGQNLQFPDACYSDEIKDKEDPRLNFFSSICLTRSTFFANATDTKEENYAFMSLPVVFLLQGFLSYVPYLLYAASTESIILPVLNEGRDMTKITTLEAALTTSSSEESDKNSPDAEEEELKNLQRQMEMKIKAKMRLFVAQRLKSVAGKELYSKYILFQVFLKFLVMFLQIFLLLFLFGPDSFPSLLYCDPTAAAPEAASAFTAASAAAPGAEAAADAALSRLYVCVFPRNRGAFYLWVVDVGVAVTLPVVSFVWYVIYVKFGFRRDISRAKILRRRDEVFVFEQKFVASLMENEVDDVLLTLGLLHSNVDKYVAMRIVSTFCDMTEWKETEE